jgi:shikimate kinase
VGLGACGETKWLFSADEELEFSHCEYMVLVMDWIGRTQLIKATGVSYTAYSEARRVLAEASTVFPDVT